MYQILTKDVANQVMHRFLVITMILIPFGSIEQAYSQHWTSGIKATGSDQSNALYSDSDIVVDGQGNIVIAGYFQEKTLSFGSFTIETDDDYYADIFICRMGGDGAVQWLQKIEGGSTYGDQVGLHVDDEKNIYLTGGKGGKIFVTKYDSTGAQIWNATDLGEQKWGYGTAVKTDIFDNVYVSGGGGWNFFVAKLNDLGQVIWVKDLWHNYSDACIVTDIEVDVLGNIYFAGNFSITLKLDQITLENSGNYAQNVFWGKMNTQGIFIWVKSATGRCTDEVSLELTTDGNLFLIGGVQSTLNFGGYLVYRGNCCQGATSFIAKSDISGKVLWAKPGTDNYYGSVPYDAKVDRAGNLYLTGGYFTCYGTGCTEGDFYVEKYDSGGSPLWRTDFEGYDIESSKAIDIDNNDYLYLLGVNASPTFIDQEEWEPIRTYGVGKFNTESSTYNKITPRPKAERMTWICNERNKPSSLNLTAQGSQIQWYHDAELLKKIGEGNEYTAGTVQTDTFYVTQTIGGIESLPRPVIVRVSSIPDGNISMKMNTLSAPEAEGVSYQWVYQGEPIENAIRSSVELDPTKTYSNYSVVLSEGPCQRLLKTIVVSIETENGLQAVKCYPNPTSSSIFVHSSDPWIISSIRIKNSTGEDVPFVAHSASNEYEIDLSNQKAGLYLIDIVQSNMHRYIKVIKQ